MSSPAEPGIQNRNNFFSEFAELSTFK
jgi:hypothetical protein